MMTAFVGITIAKKNSKKFPIILQKLKGLDVDTSSGKKYKPLQKIFWASKKVDMAQGQIHKTIVHDEEIRAVSRTLLGHTGAMKILDLFIQTILWYIWRDLC